MKKIGLALGGGGAKGIAHIPMLEVLDELGIRPHCITGTSIGSIVGALYAAGSSGKEIREGVERMVITKGDSFKHALRKKDALRLITLLDLQFDGTGLLKGDKFISFLYELLEVSTFEELKIPLQIVATDFWTAQQVVLDSGPLLPAVKASMGLPGVFTPVTHDGHILIDGGGVNPVPHDLLTGCDIVIAIDVMGTTEDEEQKLPNFVRAVLSMFDIMQKSIITEKLKATPPDIYIKPKITGVDILDFYKADVVYEQAQPACKKLREKLERLL